jgi:hypothetical protein
MWVSAAAASSAASCAPPDRFSAQHAQHVLSFFLTPTLQGEHMHHGYYPKGGAPKSNQQAQVDMIEETLRWAGVESATKVSPAAAGSAKEARWRTHPQRRVCHSPPDTVELPMLMPFALVLHRLLLVPPDG